MRVGLIVAFSLAPAFAAEVRQWEPFEIELTAKSQPANGYVDGLPANAAPMVRATFRQGSGPAFVLTGFWDGGRTWKVRFAPPREGEWTYETASADAGLNGVRGALTCRAWNEEEKQANPTRRGFIRVARGGPRFGRYFEYADGTPFLWIGDTWWAWAKKGIRFDSFRRLADDRAAKGYSVGQMYFSGNEWLLDAKKELPDLENIRRVEEFIRYANSKGITVWIHPWWGGKDLNTSPGAQKMRRWARYAVHRLGSYNVIWVLAGEYNMNNYGGLGLEFWKDLGALIRSEDPYKRIIGAHPTPPGWGGGADAPQWSTGEVLHEEPWLDYNQSQVGHGKWRNEMIPSVIAADYRRQPAKPVVVTEPWYEFARGNPPAEDVRFGAWAAMLSGAAGHTYGGGHVWWAHVPEAPADQGNWPLERDFNVNTLDYPGALSVAFMAKFLRGMEWWRLQPVPQAVGDYPEKLCAGDPGNEYVVYARWGGALRLDLRHIARTEEFRYRWIDLTESKERTAGTVQGGAWREFQTPEGYPRHPVHRDWLLHVRRVEKPQ